LLRIEDPYEKLKRLGSSACVPGLGTETPDEGPTNASIIDPMISTHATLVPAANAASKQITKPAFEARTIVFLKTQQADGRRLGSNRTRYITRQHFNVDGGHLRDRT